MPTKTDLDGMMIECEDQLRAWYAGELTDRGRPVPVKACKAVVKHRGHGTSAFIELCKFAIAEGRGQAENIRERMEQEIIGELGLNPSGFLRIRIYENGRGANAAIKMERELDPLAGVHRDVSNEMLERILRQERAKNETLILSMERQNIALGSHLASMSGHVVKLSSSRGVAASARDMGSIGSLIGLGGLLLGYPIMKRRLGLTEGASMDEVAERLMGAFDDLSQKNGNTPLLPKDLPTLPVGAGPEPRLLETSEGREIPEVLEYSLSGAVTELLQTEEGRAKFEALVAAAKMQGHDLAGLLGIESTSEPEPAT